MRYEVSSSVFRHLLLVLGYIWTRNWSSPDEAVASNIKALRGG